MKRLLAIACLPAFALAACSVSETEPDTAPDGEEAADLTPEGPSMTARLFGGGEPVMLDVQQAHANGLVLQLDTIQAKPTETVIAATVINGDDRENSLNKYSNKNTYIVSADGSKLYLSPPTSNEKLQVPAGQRMQAELVFLGRLSPDGPATLIVNDGSDTDNQHTNQPGFRIPLPLTQAAFSDDGLKKKLSRSQLVGEVSRSTLAAGAAVGGSSAMGEIASSTTSSMEAIRSELGATETARGTVIALPGDVLFDFDKADIRADARPTLDKLAQLIGPEGAAKIAIEGHTDSKGDDTYNRRLSERRAQAVRDYLKDVRRIPAGRMTTKGIGEDRPVAQNMTPEGSENAAGMAENRRVEVIIGKS